MNSNSKKFDPCHEKHDDDCVKPSRKCHKKEDQELILLKIGNPQNTIIASTAVNGNVFTVASLPVKIGCLDDPEIKVDFTTNLAVGATPPSAGIPVLTFQVIKSFISPFNPLTSINVGPAWTYSPNTTNVSSFNSFFVADNNDFDGGFFNYSVTATISGLATSVATIGGPFSLTNSTLATIVAAEKED